MAKLSLQTPTARARLAPRGKPYKVRLLPGVHLGYRAAQSGTGSWVVIAAGRRRLTVRSTRDRETTNFNHLKAPPVGRRMI
jgi:hypothetical protein